jgi:hypothetical protein
MSELPSVFTGISPFKDVFVPAIAALVGFWLATRKFRHERLWQEKYVAYQRILGAMEAMRFWAHETADSSHALPTIGWYDGKSEQQFYAEAQREISKQTSIGSLLLPEGVVIELRALEGEVFRAEFSFGEDRTGDHREDADLHAKLAAEIVKIVEARIASVVRLARADLGA